MARPRAPALGRLRLASVDDAPLIMGLVNPSMSINFRVENSADIVYLIENCVISICQLDINDSIVGFLAAKDYPLIPSIHPRAWEDFVWTKYKAIDLCSRNTLFIHMLCWDMQYSRELVDNILRSMFMHDPYLQVIAMTKSVPAHPLLIPGQSRSEGGFRRVVAMERGVRGEMLPVLCVAEREEICPRLRIRRAVEEDNDDIVPIIEHHSPRLRQIYGEFYVSELISRHPESPRVLLVCEHKELAVGVMCLNTQINYEALEESFELSPFAGLRHLETKNYAHDHSQDAGSNISGSAISVNHIEQHSQVQIEYDPRSSARKSRVTWLFNEDDFKSVVTSPPPPCQISQSNVEVLSLLEDDEDELEFDIVNIDTNLMRVPKILTYDTIEKGLADTIMKMLDETPNDKVTEDKRAQRKEKRLTTTLWADKVPEPVRYSGKPNAFLLELFAMHQNYDERYGFDMLEAAFELFPDRNYCVLCLPSNHPPFPLLEHFTLVTPYGFRMRFVNETLYVAHINSLKGDVSVRLAEASDVASVTDILEHSPRMETLLDLFNSSFCSSTLNSFVLLSQKQPVGMVITGPLENEIAIRTQYTLEPEARRPGTDGTVLAGVLSPVMEPHGRWYMRDVLRQSQYTTLFWVCRLFAKGDVSPSRNLMSLAGHMSPVLPRKSVPNISGNKGLDKIFQDVATPFALWVLERPLTSLPKVLVNNSIVVVGASRTGLSFLETIIMGPTSQYLTFTNITLVSEHGLPTAAECLRAAATCLPREGRYSDRYLKSVPFYFYIDVMHAAMVHIDRQMKCIHLKGGGKKYYDELVLTVGHQFQHPEYLYQSLELVKEVEKGKPCDRILMDDPKYQPDSVPDPPDMPENLMLINSIYEANICLKKLLRMISEEKSTKRCLSEDNQVVVYGDCVEAYNCLAALLELGLAAEMLTFVEPFPPEDGNALRVNCFNDETIDERVQDKIEELGIRVLRGCSLAGWRQVDGYIEALQLMGPLHTLKLSCFALFYYGLKAIDIKSFKAINKSGLVYDGGLVVGAAFETNDPHIFGAGACVKYSRRLYADRFQHKYYCSEDVGQALGEIFLRNLNPFLSSPDTKVSHSENYLKYNSSLLNFKGDYSSVSNVSGLSRRWQKVKTFDSPIVHFSILPGPYYYLKVRKPGIEIPMEVQMSLPDRGHTLTTDKNGNYFRLQLNSLHCVEAVTCLSSKQFHPEILSQLYGNHEAFFHELLYRYETHEIQDLYEFFTQPWMAAMYQDTFNDLLRDINEQDVGTIYDLIRSQYPPKEDAKSTSKANSCDSMSCGLKKVNKLGTFRSVIDRFVARAGSAQIVTVTKDTNLLSECGQPSALRGTAHMFWRAVGGERLVLAHLARYLARHSVTTPHYARPSHDDV